MSSLARRYGRSCRRIDRLGTLGHHTARSVWAGPSRKREVTERAPRGSSASVIKREIVRWYGRKVQTRLLSRKQVPVNASGRVR